MQKLSLHYLNSCLNCPIHRCWPSVSIYINYFYGYLTFASSVLETATSLGWRSIISLFYGRRYTNAVNDEGQSSTRWRVIPSPVFVSLDSSRTVDISNGEWVIVEPPAESQLNSEVQFLSGNMHQLFICFISFSFLSCAVVKNKPYTGAAESLVNRIGKHAWKSTSYSHANTDRPTAGVCTLDRRVCFAMEVCATNCLSSPSLLRLTRRGKASLPNSVDRWSNG